MTPVRSRRRIATLTRQVVVRLEPALYDEIEAAALAADRTVAQEIRRRLKSAATKERVVTNDKTHSPTCSTCGDSGYINVAPLSDDGRHLSASLCPDCGEDDWGL